jgi:hypothetical protein
MSAVLFALMRIGCNPVTVMQASVWCAVLTGLYFW